jgi:hypothetical protein
VEGKPKAVVGKENKEAKRDVEEDEEDEEEEEWQEDRVPPSSSSAAAAAAAAEGGEEGEGVDIEEMDAWCKEVRADRCWALKWTRMDRPRTCTTSIARQQLNIHTFRPRRRLGRSGRRNSRST